MEENVAAVLVNQHISIIDTDLLFVTVRQVSLHPLRETGWGEWLDRQNPSLTLDTCPQGARDEILKNL